MSLRHFSRLIILISIFSLFASVSSKPTRYTPRRSLEQSDDAQVIKRKALKQFDIRKTPTRRRVGAAFSGTSPLPQIPGFGSNDHDGTRRLPQTSVHATNNHGGTSHSSPLGVLEPGSLLDVAVDPIAKSLASLASDLSPRGELNDDRSPPLEEPSRTNEVTTEGVDKECGANNSTDEEGVCRVRGDASAPVIDSTTTDRATGTNSDAASPEITPARANPTGDNLSGESTPATESTDTPPASNDAPATTVDRTPSTDNASTENPVFVIDSTGLTPASDVPSDSSLSTPATSGAPPPTVNPLQSEIVPAPGDRIEAVPNNGVPNTGAPSANLPNPPTAQGVPDTLALTDTFDPTANNVGPTTSSPGVDASATPNTSIGPNVSTTGGPNTSTENVIPANNGLSTVDVSSPNNVRPDPPMTDIDVSKVVNVATTEAPSVSPAGVPASVLSPNDLGGLALNTLAASFPDTSIIDTSTSTTNAPNTPAIGVLPNVANVQPNVLADPASSNAVDELASSFLGSVGWNSLPAVNTPKLDTLRDALAALRQPTPDTSDNILNRLPVDVHVSNTDGSDLGRLSGALSGIPVLSSSTIDTTPIQQKCVCG